jgi:hypothetical protein
VIICNLRLRLTCGRWTHSANILSIIVQHISSTMLTILSVEILSDDVGLVWRGLNKSLLWSPISNKFKMLAQQSSNIVGCNMLASSEHRLGNAGTWWIGFDFDILFKISSKIVQYLIITRDQLQFTITCGHWITNSANIVHHRPTYSSTMLSIMLD